MKRDIHKSKNGWRVIDKGEFWAHYQEGKETGLVIAKRPLWTRVESVRPINRKVVYHARCDTLNGSRKGFDIGTTPTLAKAKKIAESRLSRATRSVL